MKATSCIIVAFAALALGARPVSATATPLSQTYGATKSAPATKPAQAVKVVDDKALTDRIEARLKADASLKKFNISASVSGGVATLTGTVRTKAEKLRAARDARVPGVTRVDNQIKLDKDAGKSVGQEMKETAKTVGEKTKEGAQTVAEKTKQGVSKTGEVITDAWITARVHSNFMGEDLLKGSDINVDTSNHVVTLRGTVKSEAGRMRAVEVAKKVEGVDRVVDQLTIK